MKSTGIIRRVDDLGRVVIPKEIRRNLGIYEGEALEIYVGDGGVLFKKFDTHLSRETQALWDKVEMNIPYDDPNRHAILDALTKAKNLLQKSENRD